MIKRFLLLFLVIVLIIGFFHFGGSISIVDGVPKISFTGDWKEIGRTVGKALGEFWRSFVAAFKSSAAPTPTETTPNEPTSSIPSPTEQVSTELSPTNWWGISFFCGVLQRNHRKTIFLHVGCLSKGFTHL